MTINPEEYDRMVAGLEDLIEDTLDFTAGGFKYRVTVQRAAVNPYTHILHLYNVDTRTSASLTWTWGELLTERQREALFWMRVGQLMERVK